MVVQGSSGKHHSDLLQEFWECIKHFLHGSNCDYLARLVRDHFLPFKCLRMMSITTQITCPCYRRTFSHSVMLSKEFGMSLIFMRLPISAQKTNSAYTHQEIAHVATVRSSDSPVSREVIVSSSRTSLPKSYLWVRIPDLRLRYTTHNRFKD